MIIPVILLTIKIILGTYASTRAYLLGQHTTFYSGWMCITIGIVMTPIFSIVQILSLLGILPDIDVINWMGYYILPLISIGLIGFGLKGIIKLMDSMKLNLEMLEREEKKSHKSSN